MRKPAQGSRSILPNSRPFVQLWQRSYRIAHAYFRWAELQLYPAGEGIFNYGFAKNPFREHECSCCIIFSVPAIFGIPFLSAVASAMYVLAVLLTPVAVRHTAAAATGRTAQNTNHHHAPILHMSTASAGGVGR